MITGANTHFLLFLAIIAEMILKHALCDDDFEQIRSANSVASKLGDAMNKSERRGNMRIENGAGHELEMYYGSYGGASNCENCLVKARWLAEELGVKTLHVPACKRKPGDEFVFPTMNILDYFDRESVESCSTKGAKKFEVQSLGRRVTAEVVNGMPCFELVDGWCKIEQRRLGEYLVPKHEYEIKWAVVTDDLEVAREYAGPLKEVLFAGMFDFEPVNPSNGKKYPNVWTKEAEKYVKGDSERLGWVDEAVEKRKREHDDKVKSKWKATGEQAIINNNNNLINSIPRKDLFQRDANAIEKRENEMKFMEEAWSKSRRKRNLLAFSSIEPCYSNGNLNRDIYEQANLEIEKLRIEPRDTLCVHWRQEDFLWKKIGNEFVKNISYAADRIIERAKEMQLKTVLLLTNDPEVYPDNKLYDGRVAVNTLRSLLHELGDLRVEWSMHRTEPDKNRAIYIDKATCSMMVDFIGTGKSSFTATIMDMRQTHELCSFDDPDDASSFATSSVTAKLGKVATTTSDDDGNYDDNNYASDTPQRTQLIERVAAGPRIKYKMCLKEKYGGSRSDERKRSPFIFPIDAIEEDIEHPISTFESLLDGYDKHGDNEDEDDNENTDDDDISFQGGPEVVDMFYTKQELDKFRAKMNEIEPLVERTNHDEIVKENEEEDKEETALNEFISLRGNISMDDLKEDLSTLDDAASVECDRCYLTMPQSEVSNPDGDIWLRTPSCEKCGVELLRAQKRRAEALAP